MTCIFYRTTIVGTDETEMNELKVWADSEYQDEHDNQPCEDQCSISLHESEDSAGFILIINSFIDDNNYTTDDLNNIIKNKFDTYDKSNIVSIKSIMNASCSHDEVSSEPDVVTTEYEWVSQ